MVSQTQSLQLRQSQNLVMTQSMQQSLKILQLSSLELSEYIDAELEKNPLLEVEGETEDKDAIKETAEDFDREDVEKDFSERDTVDNFDSKDFSEKESDLDGDFSSSWNASDEQSYSRDDSYNSENVLDIKKSSMAEDDAGTIIEKTITKEISLKDHLFDQINVDFGENKDKIIAEHIIDMVDASGYLSSETLDEDIKNLAEQLGCEVDDIEYVIRRLQKCDPLGVCSRNLKECLKTQLKERKTMDPAIEKLVDNLELLAKGEIDKLRKVCGVDAEDLTEMIKEIKSLNPRPAVGFSEDKVQTKHADLILEKKNGQWQLDLNWELMPKIALRRDYYNKIKANKLKGDDKKYVTEHYNSANFLLRAVHQRCETMLKVGEAIVLKQTQFLDKGINYLRPISMKNIAEEVGMHESTIGRVVANKYIATPRGVYELKYFFTTGLASTANSGEAEFSSETARHIIKEMIEGEKQVLSDDDIANMLKEKGIDIARRTVAKYREAMNIPTSAVRKRLKKISG
jgi:RNA polymerase sigma-54 factor